MKLYNKVIVRLGVTILAVIITQLCYKKYLSSLDNDQTILYLVFQNLWLTCAFAVTTLVTGVMFICIYLTANPKVRKKGLIVFPVFLLFFITTYIFATNIGSKKEWLIFIPVAFAFLVLIVDMILSQAGLEKLKKNYLPFDLAIFIGVLVVAILQIVNKNGNLSLIYGFGGGASAFQLIMANIVFNPSNYIQSAEKT